MPAADECNFGLSGDHEDHQSEITLRIVALQPINSKICLVGSKVRLRACAESLRDCFNLPYCSRIQINFRITRKPTSRTLPEEVNLAGSAAADIVSMLVVHETCAIK